METFTVDTSRIVTHCWSWGPPDAEPVLLVHGNLTTGRFWKRVGELLSDTYRVVAPDMRSFGRTEKKAVDARRGVRDWSDDLRALVERLDWAERGAIHLGGWSMGGSIAQQYAIDHPADLASITLLAPVSPYGFGATKDVEGTPTAADFAGSGGGTAAPDFVRRLAARDYSEEEPLSSVPVVMRTYFWSPNYNAPDERELLDEVMTTVVGDAFYPGDALPSSSWPLVAPGESGVLNALSAKWCDTSAIAEIEPKPPILWIRGDEDPVISDASLFDFGQLGKLGAVPGWPGEGVYPPQPMIGQIRAVLERYRANGGRFQEAVLERGGHGPLIERAEETARLIRDHIAASRPVGT
jgi:pimeloyl-ACP methyl ester carboxylesterase